MTQKRNRFLLMVLAFAFSISLQAQNGSKIFTLKEFYEVVLANHPIAKQAFMLSDYAKSEVLMAKGLMDAKFDFELTQKYLQGQDQLQNKQQGTNYYTYMDNDLKIPLWFGPDLQFGFEDNTGKLVNPTSFTPPGGLAYAGLKIPLIQGMVIDERRAAVKQARLLQQMAEFERIKLINKVLYGAIKEYLDWVFYAKKYEFLKEAYLLAQIRYQGVSERVKNGDLAAIDTLDALVILQDRLIEWQNAENDLQNAQVAVSTYLWTPQNEPLEITEGTMPQEDTTFIQLKDPQISAIIQRQNSQHPEILKLDYKLKQYEIEVKLARDKLLPNFDLDYKYLTSNISNYTGEISGNYFLNNYKVGLTLTQPIFLRKERAKIQMSKIKLAQTQLERNLAVRQVTNSINQVANDLSTYSAQLQQAKKMVSYARLLRDAEQDKFSLGESSIFLVNSRDTKWLESQIKMADLSRKLEKTKYELLFEAGVNGLKWE
ncbi:MAG: TolC family protein [Cytophagales bacterium]|nr:TolC family protein [Cytophagales bacterium]